MAITLPTPVRVAAGLVGSALDHVGKLPEELPALGVSLAGLAFRLTLRARQQVATLAVRGDDLLSGITGGPEEERPAWATFDEDQPAAAQAPPRTARASARDRLGTEAAAAETSARNRRRAATEATATHHTARGIVADSSAALADLNGQAGTRAEQEVAGSAARRASRRRAGAPLIGESAATDRSLPVTARRRAMPAPSVTGVPTAAAIPANAGADSPVDILALPLSALQERLPDLTEAQIRGLLAKEETGSARAAQLTVLTNRLTTLGHTDQ